MHGASLVGLWLVFFDLPTLKEASKENWLERGAWHDHQPFSLIHQNNLKWFSFSFFQIIHAHYHSDTCMLACFLSFPLSQLYDYVHTAFALPIFWKKITYVFQI